MAVWTKEVATEFNFPNITVYRLLKDGVHNSWRFVSNDGYVLRDTSAQCTEPDPVTLEPVPVTYYYTNVDCPLNYDFDNFTWIAVLRSTVDENCIM
jgi:hypothetical protein